MQEGQPSGGGGIDATAEAVAACLAGLPLGIAIAEIVHAADVDQLLKPQVRLVAQRGADLEQISGGDLQRQFIQIEDG